MNLRRARGEIEELQSEMRPAGSQLHLPGTRRPGASISSAIVRPLAQARERMCFLPRPAGGAYEVLFDREAHKFMVFVGEREIGAQDCFPHVNDCISLETAGPRRTGSSHPAFAAFAPEDGREAENEIGDWLYGRSPTDDEDRHAVTATPVPMRRRNPGWLVPIFTALIVAIAAAGVIAQFGLF